MKFFILLVAGFIAMAYSNPISSSRFPWQSEPSASLLTFNPGGPLIPIGATNTLQPTVPTLTGPGAKFSASCSALEKLGESCGPFVGPTATVEPTVPTLTSSTSILGCDTGVDNEFGPGRPNGTTVLPVFSSHSTGRVPTTWVTNNSYNINTCPSTLKIFPTFSHGPTLTVHASTETTTVSKDCGQGCNTIVVTRMAGHGPLISYAVTTTVEECTTITDYSCAKRQTAAPVISINVHSSHATVHKPMPVTVPTESVISPTESSTVHHPGPLNSSTGSIGPASQITIPTKSSTTPIKTLTAPTEPVPVPDGSTLGVSGPILTLTTSAATTITDIETGFTTEVTGTTSTTLSRTDFTATIAVPQTTVVPVAIAMPPKRSAEDNEMPIFVESVIGKVERSVGPEEPTHPGVLLHGSEPMKTTTPVARRAEDKWIPTLFTEPFPAEETRFPSNPIPQDPFESFRRALPN